MHHKQPRRCLYLSRDAFQKEANWDTFAIVLIFKDGSSTESYQPLEDSPVSSTPTRPLNPNPGFLGASSHISIFSHLIQDANDSPERTATSSVMSRPEAAPNSIYLDEEPIVKNTVDLMRHVFQSFPLNAMQDLISFWRATGANLALAEPFVDECSRALGTILEGETDKDDWWHHSLTHLLLRNSRQTLEIDPGCSISDFTAQFVGQNLRWETVGIFFTAVIRATMEVPFFPSLYKLDVRRQQLVGLAIKVSDALAEICISLDCLNDLQLIAQYENFIAHSYVLGIQCKYNGTGSAIETQLMHLAAYSSWRRLGDVIASITALGYHQKPPGPASAPLFLVELRKTAFARIYSADKNFSIFLGRSPRLSKRFCHLQVPQGRLILDSEESDQPASDKTEDWTQDAQACYRADTRWSAQCASLKENILAMLFGDCREICMEKIKLIRERAQKLHERDFLISARLNYLHILFLTQLVCLKSPLEPGKTIVELAQEILSLVVEAVVLRDQAVSSGTSTVWKVRFRLLNHKVQSNSIEVAHYGLPAVGIALLAMLKQPSLVTQFKIPKNRTLQDLGVLVAEIEMGTINRPGEPNFTVLLAAADTIQRFLDRIQMEDSQSEYISSRKETNPSNDSEPWDFGLSLDPWNFELGFWESLAEHPSLYNSGDQT
ncbi:fusarisetin A cluster transcription factor fsa6 [Colletotrichum asianum]|uniref:Fusarisetin A cluster transcription factor fsa6 n=1 Tax=Colletotrichum asianum TaxID=702518 RepID=A0A8H3WGV7_9PEZI|nr:fusarisetin A cluster transcription factor fsa6 [Colletotrichum asianum]